MPDLPKKKVGIVACSGEELAEGTVTRLAALRALEQLRPAETVTICLPLFLAGGEGDRAFARFYPTIAIDGCEQRCATRATEMYSGKPVAGVVVSELIAGLGLAKIGGRRHLNEAGRRAVEITAERVAGLVDEAFGKGWNRRTGAFAEAASTSESSESAESAKEAACSCGSDLPVQSIVMNGQKVALVALPLIFQQFRDSGKTPSDSTARELLETVKLYNAVPAGQDENYVMTLLREYAAFCERQGARA